jgi:hypothetical protein
MMSVKRGVQILRLAKLGLCMLMLIGLSIWPARAEFPPEGATTDPHNPSIATGDLPSLTHKGVKEHYVFYFDCGKMNWIGVPVTNSHGVQSSPPQAMGPGREFPSGPPIGSKRLATDSSRAVDESSGQSYSFQNGQWINTKTRDFARSPKLCTDAASSFGHNTLKTAPPPPPAPNEKSDKLPPPPVYTPNRDHTSSP